MRSRLSIHRFWILAGMSGMLCKCPEKCVESVCDGEHFMLPLKVTLPYSDILRPERSLGSVHFAYSRSSAVFVPSTMVIWMVTRGK
jgi:hypothetical protein